MGSSQGQAAPDKCSMTGLWAPCHRICTANRSGFALAGLSSQNLQQQQHPLMSYLSVFSSCAHTAAWNPRHKYNQEPWSLYKGLPNRLCFSRPWDLLTDVRFLWWKWLRWKKRNSSLLTQILLLKDRKISYAEKAQNNVFHLENTKSWHQKN